MAITRSKFKAQAANKEQPQQSTLIQLQNEPDKSYDNPIFFWKPNELYGFLGQWYKAPFTDPETNLTFQCAEQYMMYQKAMTFNDTIIAEAIMDVPDQPKAQKALGRKVSGFTDHEWNKVKKDIVVRANILKFTQCLADREDRLLYPPNGFVETLKEQETEEVKLKDLLMATGRRELVEASALDRIWGIGFSPAKAGQVDRAKWGKNLLGQALMEVREKIRKMEEAAKNGGKVAQEPEAEGSLEQKRKV